MHWMIVLLDALGIPWVNRPGDRAGPHRQDHIALFQELGGVIAPDAHEQRVVLRERPLRLQRRDHRRVQRLRERFQLRRRPGVDHALPRVYQRVLGVQQQVHCRVHVVGVRSRPVPLRRKVRVGGLVEGRRRVRYRQHHRPRPSAAQHRERPPHELRHPRRAVDISEPLGYSLQ